MVLTEHSHTVIFPWGQDKKIFKRHRDMRYAKKGEVFMRCGKCGKTDFTVLVKPTGLGGAQVTTLACSLCNKTFFVNGKGELGGSLKIEEADARKREEINERPDT